MPETNNYWPEENDEALKQWQAEMAQVILNERTPEVAKNVLDRAHEMAVPDSNGATGVLSITSSADTGPRNLARMLYQNLGDKVLDLAYALLASGRGVSRDDLTADAAQKRAEVERCAQTPMNEDQRFYALYLALGDKFIEKQRERGVTDVGEILKITLTLIATKEEVRKKLLEAARVMARGRDASEAWTIAVQGSETLREIDQITDYEWWENLRANQTELGHTLNDRLKGVDDEGNPTPFARREAAIKRFFEEHPKRMRAKKLRKVIDCQRYREELGKLRVEHNPMAVAAKETEIINRVFAEVVKYKRRQVDDNERFTDYERGFPVNIVKNRDLSCFAAPWLIATLLEECGLNPKDMFYCAANQISTGTLGSHGALAVKTAMKDLVLVDVMGGMPSQLPLSLVKNKEGLKKVANLADNVSKEPARVMFDRKLAFRFQLPIDFYLVELDNGLASGHMLHTGLSFFHNGQLDEAKYAFKLALDLNEKNPDACYYLGQIACKEGSTAEAKRLFKRCIEIFDKYMLAHFALAEMALAEGKEHETMLRLIPVVANNDAVYADKLLYHRARTRFFPLTKDYDAGLGFLSEYQLAIVLGELLDKEGTMEELLGFFDGAITEERMREIACGYDRM